jgi:hypothetical protein
MMAGLLTVSYLIFWGVEGLRSGAALRHFLFTFE